MASKKSIKINYVFIPFFLRSDDSCDMTRSYNVNRRKTDLMPTIPSPRDTSRSSFGTYTPRTPGSKTDEDETFLNFYLVSPCLIP